MVDTTTGQQNASWGYGPLPYHPKINKVGRWRNSNGSTAIITSLDPWHHFRYQASGIISEKPLSFWQSCEALNWTYLGPIEPEKKGEVLTRDCRTDFHIKDAEGNEHHIRWEGRTSDGDLRTLATVITQVADLSQKLKA